MNDQSSVQSSRVYILYGVLIALLAVSILVVIIAGTRESSTDSPPPTTPTPLPTTEITPITKEMLDQQFVPANHVITVTETGIDKTQISAKVGQMLQLTNNSTTDVTMKVGVDSQIITPGASFGVFLSAIGQQSFIIEKSGQTYTLNVIVD